MRVEYDKLIPALKRLLPAQGLDRLGAATRFIRRLRTVSASMFVWAVVLSRFGQGTPGFDQARRWFNKLSATGIWARPFQMRFKRPETVRMFEEAFDAAVESWRTKKRTPRHPLVRHFADVVAWDSTVVQVSDALRGHFKGTRGAAASLKVTLGVSLWGLLPVAARVDAGNCHDMKLGPPLDLFRKGTLLLFDKGFVAYSRLAEIGRTGHFFLCPMRLNGDAEIVEVHQAPNTAKKACKSAACAQAPGARPRGLMLREVLPKDKRIRKHWDLEVLVRGYDKRPTRVRLVIVPGPDGKQQPYLTNLGPAQWRPEALRELYRLRWQVELVFKELKQHLNLTAMPSKDPFAVQVLAWASLIALALSRTVADWIVPLHRHAGLAFALRPAVLTRALRSHIHLLGRALSLPIRQAVALLEVLALQLLDEASQPARARPDSFKRLEGLLNAA